MHRLPLSYAYRSHRSWPLLVTLWVTGQFGAAALGQPLDTAFTYQGRLNDGGNPANGSYDLQFSLHREESGGGMVAGPVCGDDVDVQDGLFTALVDFGSGVFNGEVLWLELAVRADVTPGNCATGGYSVLTPRQALTNAPNALFALNAATAYDATTASNATQLNGQPASYYRDASNINSGTLSLSGTSDTPIILGENASTALGAMGVLGYATGASGPTFGVFGESASTDGRAIGGFASATSGTTYGGRFQSNSTDGRGAFGLANALSGITYGGYFESASTSGRGVHGQANAAAGFTLGVSGVCNSTDGRGVFGQATAATGATYGVYGQSASTNGQGVFGQVTAASGLTYGGRFESASTSGRGVFGSATATSGGNYGVHGTSNSPNGFGVRGDNSASTGDTYGGQFLNQSTSGGGVFGKATSFTGTTYGVYGETNSTSGSGVYGTADAASGTTHGVWGQSSSISGRGVLGQATAASGTTYGGRFESSSTSGFGVRGDATAGTGTTVGVWGQSNSPDGYAGYFVGDQSYFEGNVGIGTATPDGKLHVIGGSDAEPASGGYFVAGETTSTNVAIDNNEIMARNNGATAALALNGDGGNVNLIQGGTGNVGIGTSSPGAKLDVNGAARTDSLEVNGGAIRVLGAGVNTNTAAFIHVAAGGDGNETAIDHPMSNGNPDAMIFVTARLSCSSGTCSPFLGSDFDVRYNPAFSSRWKIRATSATIEAGQQFNVLIILP